MREGSPRVGAVVFENFCLDGTSFGSDENSYVNGKTGILIETDNDACRVRDMGMVYLEHALIVRGADALDVSGNFLTECGSCVELLGAGQATRDRLSPPARLLPDERVLQPDALLLPWHDYP